MKTEYRDTIGDLAEVALVLSARLKHKAEISLHVRADGTFYYAVLSLDNYTAGIGDTVEDAVDDYFQRFDKRRDELVQQLKTLDHE